MQFYKEILNWLDGLEKNVLQEALIGRYSDDPEDGKDRRIYFNLKEYRPVNADWLRAFRESAELPSLRSLRVDMKQADWNNDVLEQCGRIFPNLKKLELRIKGSKNFGLSLNFRNLQELDIDLSQKPDTADLSFIGSLPSLETLTFRHSGIIPIDTVSITELLLSSKNLKKISLYFKGSWQAAEKIFEELKRKNVQVLPFLTALNSFQEISGWHISERSEQQRSDDGNSLKRLLEYNADIDLDSVIAVCTDREKFTSFAEHFSKKTDHLHLDGTVHSFILEEPDLLRNFTKLSSLRVFHAGSLTTENFQKICDMLPNLTVLTLINNHNPGFKSLSFRSNTLKELYLTHFHRLETFEIHSVSLEKLELDNCSDSSTVDYPETNMRWCQGIYGEKFLSALLNGDKSLHLPNLQSLMIWHNHNGFGPPLVYENMRMDIECSVGHSALEELVLSRLSHIRNLTLKNLPKLKTLSVFDDFEENEGWMEKLDISQIPKDCEIIAEGHSGPSRKSEDYWSGNI